MLGELKLHWNNLLSLQHINYDPKLKNFVVNIPVELDAAPKYFHARAVPYSLREKTETELDCLVKNGVYQQVSHSEWATPIVPVVKEDDSVCICGD